MGKYSGYPGDYSYSRKEWATKAARAARRKGFRASIHGPTKDSYGRKFYEVRVRRK